MRIGDVLLKQGDVQKALEQYQDVLKISKRRAEADPKDAQAQRDLYISHNNIGNVLLQQGDVQKAMEQYQDGLKISKRLTEADPRSFEAQMDLIISHYKLGLTEKEAGSHADAATRFDDGLAVLTLLDKAGKLRGTRFASWPGLFDAQRRLSRDRLFKFYGS
jgi:tetratricopeptide (TPR) repeat protein